MLFLSELLPLALLLNGVFIVCELVDVGAKDPALVSVGKQTHAGFCCTICLVYVQYSRVFCYKLDPFPAFDEPMAKLRVYNNIPLKYNSVFSLS